MKIYCPKCNSEVTEIGRDDPDYWSILRLKIALVICVAGPPVLTLITLLMFKD